MILIPGNEVTDREGDKDYSEIGKYKVEQQGETDHETVFVDGPSWGRGRSSPWTSATKFRTYWADVNAVGEKNAASSNNLTFSIASLSKSISLNRPENFSALL